MTSTNYILLDVHTGKHFDRSSEFRRQGGDGMRHRDPSEHHSESSSAGCAENCTSCLKKVPGGWLYDLRKTHVTELVV
jgi:hypothetical protein